MIALKLLLLLAVGLAVTSVAADVLQARAVAT